MLILNVPYAEKDEAKYLGAQWNPDIRKWCVYNRRYYGTFLRWVTDEKEFLLVYDQIYIVEATYKCPQCGNTTKVFSFGVDHYIPYDYVGFNTAIDEETDGEFNDDIPLPDPPTPEALEGTWDLAWYYFMRDGDNEIHILPPFVPVPYELYKYICKHYNFKKEEGDDTYCQYCDHCNKKLNWKSLFASEESPFLPYDEDWARQIVVYKILLDHDYIFPNVTPKEDPPEASLKKYSQFIELGEIKDLNE